MHTFLSKVSTGALLALLFLFTFAYSALATAWVVEHEESVNAFYAVDRAGDSMIAVGGSGAVSYSTDGGYTWANGSSGTSEALYHVDVVAEDFAIAVGVDGVFTSENGGVTWNQEDSPTTNSIFDVDMLDESNGILVSQNAIFSMTTDGGETWGLGIFVDSEPDWFGVEYYSENLLWMVGSAGSIQYSDDGGNSWTDQVSGTIEVLHDVDFYDENNGWVVGTDGTVLKTNDAGTTWESITNAALVGGDVFAVAALSADEVLIAGQKVLSHTSDGGDTWTALGDHEIETVLGLYWEGDEAFFIAGGDASTTTDAAIVQRDSVGPSAPTDLAIVGGEPVSNSTPTISWTAAEDVISDIDTYVVKVNSQSNVEVGNVTEYEILFTADGNHSVQIWAKDTSDNVGSTATLTFTIDTVAPEIGSLSPVEGLTNETTEFSIDVSDATSGMHSCLLYINDSEIGLMTHGGSEFTYDYTFSAEGSYGAYATCIDQANNESVSDTITVNVAEGSSDSDSGDSASSDSGDASSSEEEPASSEEVFSEVAQGRLIKLKCKAGADTNDPCKAVYYYAEDGKRHAFPNEKVYFTWYSNFSHVITITDELMASISLGSNVTYHPGTRMVTFQSTHDVYAVSKDGVLRHVGTEEIAEALYGEDWNTMIDDISDAFFGNYSFGDAIEDADDYDIEAEEASVDNIDDNL